MTSASSPNADLEVAVIGMSCRFPGAPSVEAFWENLRQGVESISFFTEEDLRMSGVSPEMLRQPGYVRAAGVLDDVERFDARFFGLTAREAQILDPQHRLFLELAWIALESAGYDPDRYRGSIGVFGGASGSAHYLKVVADPRLRESVSNLQVLLSTDKDFLASRVAYKLNLGGPAVTIQTACSTSLAAVHLACQSLLAGESDMALAGGVSVSVPQKVGYVYEPDGIMSQDGHCRAFDAKATGTVRGSGVGFVVLKRLADALRDGDRIEAVLKGWAMNNDGGNRVGFTAPGVEGQARVVRMAQAMAGVEPETIGYIETHGTGTSLGDPIEVTALTHVVGAATRRRGSCAIGSVKTNVGHLDAAAGVAGLIKVVLMLKHGELVPSLHFESPNPAIDFANGPFYVSARRREWTANGAPRRAGVSAFGIGGTNVHVVVEEPPAPAARGAAGGPEVLVVSARTETALERATDNLVEHLQRHGELELRDVAFTLASGRRPFKHRRAVACGELAAGTRALADRDPRRVYTGVAPDGVRPVAFMFTGQGAQYVNMGRGLYTAEREFRAEVDACCARLEPLLGEDLRGLLYPEAGAVASAAEKLNETRFTQPALFTIEYALARLWTSWGVAPDAMIGHSVGEFVAACLAGVMTRDDALALVAERARLMQACPRGAMLAVALPEEALRPLLDGSLDLSAVHGTDASVVGGPIEEVEGLAERLKEGDVPHARVPTSHAFHSRLMEPALEPFAARVGELALRPPRVPFVSNVTGTWITPQEATDPAYWARQLVATVRFSEGLAELAREPQRVFLEIGPGPTLTSLAKRRLGPSSPGAVASLRHPREEQADELFIRQAAARLWVTGVAVDCSAGAKREGRRRVLLPTYPFEGERYTVGMPRPSAPAARAGKQGIERWLYLPSWKRSAAAPAIPSGGAEWCVLADQGGRGDALVEALRGAGEAVSVIRPGSAFARVGEREWSVDASRRADYERVIEELKGAGSGSPCYVHLRGVEAEAPLGPAGAGPVDPSLLSVLHLGQALGQKHNRETTLLVVTSGAQEVTGSEALSPRRAAVLGLCRVLPQEYPLLSVRSLDVDAAAGPAEVAEQIRAEAAAGAEEPVIAYRGRYRWIPSYDPLPAAAAPSSGGALRSDGVYFITGGLGNVGLALAERLARAGPVRLVLAGRTGLPDAAGWDDYLAAPANDPAVTARIRAVRRLEALGAQVMVVAADAADREQTREALARARRRFGGLHGVIHAAGDTGAGAVRPVASLERADCERQLRPKAQGAEVLDELLGDEPLDFVLLTSSLSTVLGGLGLGAYAAANQYLDAFARRQHQRGRRWWMSVDWDGWRFTDPAALEMGMSPEEGSEIFARVVGLARLPQVVVSTAPLAERLEQWTRADRSAEMPEPGAPVHGRPDLHTVYVPPEDATERRLAEIWAQLLGIDRVGLDDNFFELGGSSLLAVHLMGKLRKEFDADLSVATLFEAPTVRALSRVIRAPGAAASELERSQDRGQMRRQSRRDQRRTTNAVE